MREMLTERTLLLVDDEAAILNSLARELRGEGYRIFTATDGPSGLACLEGRDIGVVVSDQIMPGMDGIAFLEEVRRRRPDTIRIILTGHGTFEAASKAINHSHIFAYLTKPWISGDLRSTLRSAFDHYGLIMENRRLLRLTTEQNEQLKAFNTELEVIVRERTRQLNEALREGILMMAKAAEARDDATGMHIHRVYRITLRIGLQMGMGYGEAEQLALAAMMHDVGKLMIPDAILLKPGSLTEAEREIVKRHTRFGEALLGDGPFFRLAREICRYHHERWDGGGYPCGLKGEAIPLSARVVAVADVFDALRSERPYKRALTTEEARMRIRDEAGRSFDPVVVEAFLNLDLQFADIRAGGLSGADPGTEATHD